MKNIYLILLIFIYFFEKDALTNGVLAGFIMWQKDVIPYIFPALLIVSIIKDYNLLNELIVLLNKVFRINKTSLYYFFISFLCGCPSNVTDMITRYKNNELSNEDLSHLIAHNITFNPLFIIAFTNVKVFIIFTMSNVLSGFTDKYSYSSINLLPINFSLTESIKNSLNVCINVLGSIIFSSILINLFSFNDNFINTVFSGLIEITNGLSKNNVYFNSDIISYFFLSFGGISIFIQIKSILVDANINYKLIYTYRFITFLISCSLSFIATCCI